MMGRSGAAMPKVIDEVKIYNAALELLVSHGYEGATTQKIAHLAGVNEVTLFRNFGSKAALFKKAIDFLLADTPLGKPVFSGDLEADLLAVAQAYIDSNRSFGDIVPILLVELPRHPELRVSFDTPWENMQVIPGILQKYQELGLLKPESTFVTIAALIGPITMSEMVRRANLGLSLPAFDAQGHVAAFLHGRKI
jgi:AcrR family transcriptional regulator